MTEDSKQWSRRKLLGTSAGLAIAGLAGCSSDAGQGGSNGSAGTAGGANGNTSQQTLAYASGRSPTDVQFNRYNVANWASTLQDQFFQQVARGYSDGTIGSEFLDDLSANGNTLTLKFPKGFKWWSGKKLTAKDYHVGLEIDRLQDPKKSAIKENKLVDDYTIKMAFKQKVTPFLMKSQIAETFVNTPRWIYQKYLDRLQKANTQKKRDSVANDLATMKISAQEVVNKGIGNGLFKLDSFNSSKSVLKLFKQHPYADRTSINKASIVPASANLNSLISANKLDMQPAKLINSDTRSQFPDNDKNVYKFDYFQMEKFTFNWKNKHTGKRLVRRAIMHAVDLQPIVAAMEQSGTTTGSTVDVQSGIHPSIYEKFLGKGWVDKLIDYPTDSDMEGATQLMKDAGYSKQGGNWVDPNGNSFSLSILTQNASAQVQATKVFSDQLNEFGLQTNINSVDSTDYYQKLQNYTADIYWIWHVDVALWHPIAYFSNTFYGVLVGDPSTGNKTGPTGVPFSLTIPKKVGAKQIQNGGRTIHPAKLMNDLPTTSTTDQVKQKTRILSQWFNYDLPGIVYIKTKSGTWLDTGTFSFEKKGHKLNTDRPGQVALKNGWIDLK